MFRDTERYVKHLDDMIKTIDIVQIEVNSKHQRKGVAKAVIETLLTVMKKFGHWRALYIECVNHEGFRNYLKKRTDIVNSSDENSFFIMIE